MNARFPLFSALRGPLARAPRRRRHRLSPRGFESLETRRVLADPGAHLAATDDGPVVIAAMTAAEATALVSVEATTEGSESGPVDGVFTIRLSEAVGSATTVTYTLGGSATAGDDYTGASGQVVFAAGETEKTIVLPIEDDDTIEPTETITLEITGVTGDDAGLDPLRSFAFIRIADNEEGSLTVQKMTDGVEEGSVSATFVVSQGAVTGTATIFNFTLEGTADGADRGLVLLTAAIAAGQTEVTITVPIVNDTVAEGAETVTLRLLNIISADDSVAISSTQGQATATITDNDTTQVSVAATANGSEAADDTSEATGPTPGAFTISQTKRSSVDTVVTYTLSGAATEGSDFETISRTVTIPAGSLSVTVTVPVIDDNTVESAEGLTLTLTGVESSHGLAGLADSGLSAGITIADNDASLVSIEKVNDGDENGPTDVTFRVVLSAPSATATTVNYTLSGTSTAGSDYTAPSGSVVVAAGETEATFTIAVIDDSDAEDSESLIATLSSVSGLGGVAIDTANDEASALIEDNESIRVFVSDATNGAEAGQTAGKFTISLNQAAETDTVLTLSYGGTATEVADYAALPRTVTIPAGMTFVDVTVTIFDDDFDESDETVAVTIEGIQSGDEGIEIDATRKSGVLTIVDNDTAGIMITPVTGSAVTEDSDTIELQVVLSSQPTADVVVTLASSDTGEGILYEDTFTFTPDNWDTPQSAIVIGVDDSFVDGDKTFSVTASAESDDAIYAAAEASIDLVNQDDDTATLAVTQSAATITEGTGAGTSQVTFTFTLTGAVEGGFSASYATSDGTATVGDYTDNDGELSFSGVNGEIKTVTVVVNRDGVVEADEAFGFALLGLTGLSESALGQIAVDTTPLSVTIEDDDTATLSIAPVDQAEGTGSTATPFAFTVTLTGGVQGGLTIAAIAEALTATAGVDFTATSSTLAFAGTAGETQTFTVPVTADGLIELVETFRASLGAIGGLAAGIDASAITVATATATGTIQNDDTAEIGFDVASSTAIELNGSHTVEVRLTAPAGVTLSEPVTFRVVDLGTGTATAGVDYTFATQTITFPAGSGDGTTMTVTLSVVDDGALEPTETVALGLERVSGDSLGDAVTSPLTTHTVTITDDPMTGVVTGSVWIDADGDGVHDTDELALAGVTITLTGTDLQGTAVSMTDVTDAEGVYRFEGLTGGTYTITETSPAGYVDGAEVLGEIDGAEVGQVAADKFTDVVLPPAGEASGYDFAERGLTSDRVTVRSFVASVLSAGAPAATPASIVAASVVENLPAASVPALITAAELEAEPVVAEEETPPAPIALATAPVDDTPQELDPVAAVAAALAEPTPPVEAEAAPQPFVALDDAYAIYAMLLAQQDAEDDEDDLAL